MHKNSDELIISLFFPPSDYVSGITVFKRILNNEKAVDVLKLKDESKNTDFDSVNPFINKKIVLDLDCDMDYPSCVFKSLKEYSKLITGSYKKIYSRSWVMQNHFIALDYKLNHPDVFWCAEFSDPLILKLNHKVRDNKKYMVDNSKFIDLINGHIIRLNEKNNSQFPLLENGISLFYICEYLTYLFSDKIIFTNENQRKMMLDEFPVSLSEFVLNKSEIQMHPTLNEKFYHIKDARIDLDDDKINFAYFGRDYYGQRHFESLFYAVESLNHKFKDKLQVYIFIENPKQIKKLIKPLKSHKNFIVKKPMKYFEFLNATTKFDVLIVNDVVTGDSWPINPYLPSKLSDYMGSSADIWAFYEKESTLSDFDLKYKSDITDFKDCRNQLIEILKDYGYDDENYSVNEDYFLERLTTLNKLYDSEFKRNIKLKKENNENSHSGSWKLTKSLFKK